MTLYPSFESEVCQLCGGTGIIEWDETHYETVTRDMAIDAEDRNLEGQEIPWGTEKVQGPCPQCTK